MMSLGVGLSRGKKEAPWLGQAVGMKSPDCGGQAVRKWNTDGGC